MRNYNQIGIKFPSTYYVVSPRVLMLKKFILHSLNFFFTFLHNLHLFITVERILNVEHRRNKNLLMFREHFTYNK